MEDGLDVRYRLWMHLGWKQEEQEEEADTFVLTWKDVLADRGVVESKGSRWA